MLLTIYLAPATPIYHKGQLANRRLLKVGDPVLMRLTKEINGTYTTLFIDDLRHA